MSDLQVMHRTPQILEIIHRARYAIVICGRPQEDDPKVRVEILTEALKPIASTVIGKERASQWTDTELTRYFGDVSADRLWIPEALTASAEAMGEKP